MFKISAKNNKNVDQVCAEVRDMIDKLDEEKITKSGLIKKVNTSDHESKTSDDENELSEGEKKTLKKLLL